jgi:alpha-L-rhamnosidase
LVTAAAPRAPRFEHWPESIPALGLGTGNPRLSWVIPDAAPGFRQRSYEIEVTRQEQSRAYVVHSPDQVLVPWPAPPLASREGARVRVRVSDGQDWTDWSAASDVEVGLLDVTDWTARAISPIGLGGLLMPAPVLSASIELPSPALKARLYVTAHGLCIPTINGQRVSPDVLTPGWTSYGHRLHYQTYDVSQLVHEGVNELEFLMGNGWYRGRLGYEGARAIYGDRLALIAQLEMVTTDGMEIRLSTDEGWTSRESEVLDDDLYDGQRTDLRRGTGTEPKTLAGVDVLVHDARRLVAPEGPPMRVTEVRPAERVWTAPSGATLIDFGQIVVGWVRLRVHNRPPGAEVSVRHAEVLEGGELCTRVLRSAKATDTYWVTGADEEILEPSLTFHGFRYAEVTGGGELQADEVDAIVIGSALDRSGWFNSTNPELNQFHRNVVWSARGNFIDVPIDCPQRDERLAWTGDILAFAPTALFLFDTAGLLSSWLGDLRAEQHLDGSVPHVVPAFSDDPASSPPAAGWGDAATFVPWAVFQATGDALILERQFASMRAWVDRVAEIAGPDRIWRGGFQFGDWLDPGAPPERPADARADPTVVATAFLARSATIVAQAAAVLGLNDQAREYAALATDVRTAFMHAFVSPQGAVLSDSQTAYALAISWGLLPTEAHRQAAGQRLADLVRAGGFRIGTGFLGTPLVCDALAATGNAETAYRLLLQTGCPSWLYPVTQGATTVWERWDGIRPDGSINPGEMNSFNHYAFGAVADWMHRSVAGLAPLAPGYRSILVRPIPSELLDGASATHRTPYGEARVAWERRDGRLSLQVRIPVGATGEVHVPGAADPDLVGHGDHQWVVADPCAQRSSAAASKVRDVLDDATTWARIVATIVERGIAPEGEVEAAHRLAEFLDRPAADLPGLLAPDQGAAGSEAAKAAIQALLEPLPERRAG